MPENNRSSGVWDSKECALLLIDYQPGVMSFIGSHNRKLVELNARYLTKAALAFDIPIILSTVGVQMGVNQPTIASLRSEVPNVPEIDRTSMDSWGDRAFVEAVKKTGRKRLVMSGIVTEVCLAYPVVAALKDGYEVSIITDAAGGLTRESHDVAVLRNDPGRRRAEYDASDDHGMVSRLGRAARSRRARGHRAIPQGNSDPAEHLSSFGDRQSRGREGGRSPSSGADACRRQALRRGGNDEGASGQGRDRSGSGAWEHRRRYSVAPCPGRHEGHRRRFQ